MSTLFSHGYALLIGVGNTAHVPWSLPVTVRDVQALRQLLVDPDLCGYPDDEAHVRLLTNAAAARAGILAGLDWLRERAAADPEATTLVAYSGHGWRDRAGVYYLAPYDGDPLDRHGSLLRATEFAQALRAIRSPRLLVFMDCCHAAGMATAKDAGAGPAAPLPPGFAGAAFPTELARDLAHGRGRAIFASSREEEPSQYRPDGRLSIFTEHLLEALQGAGNRPGETRVTVGNLMTHLGRAVPASAWRLRRVVQTPVFNFEVEDFPVAALRGGKGLPAGGWATVQDEARRTIETLIGAPAIAAGAGAVVAEQIAAPVATGGSIAAGGNVTVVQGHDNVVGDGNVVGKGPGITAQTIEAQNVVDGIMAPAAALEQAGALVKWARAIERGGVHARTIKAQNVVSGIYIPTAQTVAELRQEVAQLHQRVQAVIAAGEIADPADAEDALGALTTAETELAKSDPSSGRVTRKLKEVAELLTGIAEVAAATHKVGLEVIKLAPIAMMLWKLAETVL
ncbi:MAG: caspase family protein [Anaerolineae bacterium]|nr:caspase family protein [Anaerolineae bacterium]